MRRDHAVRVRRRRWVGLCRAAGAAREAVVDERLVVVGRVAVRVHPDRVDAVLRVAALRDIRGREAPVAVARLDHPVVDLRPHRERVVRAPAAGSPVLLGHEQRGHQRLEHAAAPPRRHERAVVGVGAVIDLLAEVGAREADRPRLDPGPVARVGERPERAEVLALRDLALLDPDVAGDPALRDDGVVAAGFCARVGHVVEQDPVDAGPVVEAEVHRVEQRLRRARSSGTLRAVTRSPAASQPLSTEERIGMIGAPVGGQIVSFSPVRWSYQL